MVGDLPLESFQLSLEEEEVWRCALAWAKQRAGVTQPCAHWTEEERARVCAHLAPLMHHVRLLLIGNLITSGTPATLCNYYSPFQFYFHDAIS